MKLHRVFLILATVFIAFVYANENEMTQESIENAPIPEFIPSNEWKEVLPGQGIPAGLHVRLNLATGHREAKLMDSEDTEKESSIRMTEESIERKESKDESGTVSVEIDATGGISALAVVNSPAMEDQDVPMPHDATPANIEASNPNVPKVSGDKEESPLGNTDSKPTKEPNWNHEKIYDVLEALPEPPQVDGMSLTELRKRLTEPEFRAQMIKIWKKRQEDLQEAISTMQDDTKHMTKILEELQKAKQEGNITNQLQALEVLEWEAQDLDKTKVLQYVGGFQILSEYFESTELSVVGHTCWVFGTASKNFMEGQNWVLDAGVLPKLIELLKYKSEDNTHTLESILNMQKKAIYALSSIVRANERAQTLFLQHDGLKVLRNVLVENGSSTSIQLKVLRFIHDLLREASVENTNGSILQIKQSLTEEEWCKATATYLQMENTRVNIKQIVEFIDLMQYQLPACHHVFQVNGIMETLQEIIDTYNVEIEDRKQAVEILTQFRNGIQKKS